MICCTWKRGRISLQPGHVAARLRSDAREFVNSATQDRATRAFSDDPVAYLSQIVLTLVRQGQVLVFAR